MSENAGKIQIVLKGGKPWGFRLKNPSENRSAVIIDNIEPGGKAEIHGGLRVGDHVIKINDVLCLSLADAVQLIDSAFRTLTILVWRPSYCTQSYRSSYSSQLQTQDCDSPVYSASANKLNGSIFQKIHNVKSSSVIPNQSDRHELSYSASKSDHMSSSLQYQGYNFTATSLKYPDKPKRSSSLYSLSSTESLNKSKRNFNSNSFQNQEYFNPSLLSQSQQHANLQYICEQYPLSELFLNYKSDLKLESLVSHSKRLFKTYQNQEIGFKTLDNTKYYTDTLAVAKESNMTKTSECVCCMYPKCHSSYKKCIVHSPPERDFTMAEAKYVDDVTNQCLSYEEKCKLDSNNTYKLSQDGLKKVSSISTKTSFKIKEDCFRNSNLKIFKPIELSLDSKPIPLKSHELKPPKKDGLYYEKVAHLKSNRNESNVVPSNCIPDDKNQNFNVNDSRMFTFFSSELTPETSKERALIVSHSEQSKSTLYGQNTVQEETILEVCNQNSSSRTLTKRSYLKSYVKEKEHTESLRPNNDYVKHSNEASVINVFSTESSISDGDEDEELCLIEENARSNYSCATPQRSSATFDLALPPPPLNDDTEIIATNEPLPSPPSFSPVKDVIYENIEINKKPDEAIYANLEMLKIKCSVVNSATQTSSEQITSDLDSKQLTESFAFVETEIVHNIIAPTHRKEFRNDCFKNFLQSQLEKHSSVVKNECIQRPQEKYSIESQAISLPLTSAYFTTSEPKAKLLTRYVSCLNDGSNIDEELTGKKDELISSINKKLGILRLEQIALKEEMKQNDELGCSLAKKLAKLAQPNEVDKFKVHVEELEKITNLMISISGRLARAENALLILPSDASPDEKNILEDKYSKLNKQHEEAKYLKKSIDRRNSHVSMFLKKYFTEEEFMDYDHFITMKAKLLVDCREIDEKIKLGEEQLDALKNSVSSQSFSKVIDKCHN